MKKVTLLISILFLLTVSQANAFEFCKDGIVGEDNLRIISVDDMLKENAKEWKWENTQNIEIEIRVENKEDQAKDYVIEAVFLENEHKTKIVEDKDNLETEINLEAKERKSISLNFKIDKDADENNYNLFIKFYEKGNENKKCVENSEEELVLEKIEICSEGNVDEEDLEITKIQDNKNDWKWSPEDTLEISLDLSNKYFSERTFITKLVMLDENNNEIDFAEDSSNVEDELTLAEDEEDTSIFEFKLKSDIADGTYKLYAKAYDKENDNICTALKAEDKSNPIQIKIEREKDRVIVKEVTGPTEITVNSVVEYTVKISNTGSENQEKVAIEIYNKNLGLKQTYEIENLTSGREGSATFSFMVPENATIGEEKIVFSAKFKYDNKKDYYEEFSENNIRYEVKILEEIVEEEIIQEETIEEVINETEEIPEEIIQNETIENKIGSAITGNVVGQSSKKSLWPIIIGILAISIVGVLLLLRKSKKSKEHEYIEYPSANRRYTASLN